MPELRQDEAETGLTYQGKPRTWGIRLSSLDVTVLIVSVVITALLWIPTATYSFIGLLVVLHFFLFCNVFRIPRKPELLWGFLFLLVCAFFLILDLYSPLNVSITVLPITTVILGWSCRSHSYHGIFADRINPRLNDYLTGR